jgi:putative ABC transport system permease protein
MLADYFKIAFLMMRAKPVRAALSLLGIYIGVLALVIILSIREGIRFELDNLFRTEGAHVIFVHPGYDATRKKIGRLEKEDLDLLRVTHGVLRAFPRGTVEKPAQSPETTIQARMIGIDAQFPMVYRVPLVKGRFFIDKEVEQRAEVCLLTQDAAKKLFPTKEPIGSSLFIQGRAFDVIGIVDWTLPVSQRTSFPEVDVLVPAGSLVMGYSKTYATLEVRVDPKMSSRRALDLVKGVVSRGDVQREALYFVRSLAQGVERNKSFNEKILAGLLGIAAISLLVGGIGIANVMITSVTERTKEVGIRKALGAKRLDILAQFTVESCVLCVMGGGAAVATGALGVFLLPHFMKIPFTPVLPLAPVAGCLALTLLIGAIAGSYPASRAASLSAADALRYE